MPLDKSSSYLTTFLHTMGRYRWIRMPFGISPTPEKLQQRTEHAFQGLAGVKPILDDVLVYGYGHTVKQDIQNHDVKLFALLQHCREQGIKLDEEKFKLQLPEVAFMGHITTGEGLKPDLPKVEAIKKIPIPTCKQDVSRLLGMINYLQKFAPNLLEVTAPMQNMRKEDYLFQWDKEVQGTSFDKVKDLLPQPPVLRYFDPKLQLQLQSDASQLGLGPYLMQGGHPIAYASWALIENEMLSIVFRLEQFEQYAYGRKIRVETDHKPLESIFKKSILSVPKRLQRMLLCLQHFDLAVKYKKDSQMYLADTLSQALPPEQHLDEVTQGGTGKDNESINMSSSLSAPKDTLASIQQATASDKDLKQLRIVTQDGWPETQDNLPQHLKQYFPFWEELTFQNGPIFKGQCLVILKCLQQDMQARIHSSHTGMQGCLRWACETIYWLGMLKDLLSYISKCSTCNAYPVK